MPFKRRGKWVAKIVHNGEQVWIGSDFPTKTAAREAEDAKRLELRAPKSGRAVETCDSFALRWTSDYPRPKESTNRHNAERVRKFALEFAGVPLGDVDRVTARKWALINTGHVPAVRAMFGDAMNDGLVTGNPFAGLRIKQSRGRKDIKVLSERELYQLADAALKVHGNYGPEFRAYIIFAAYVGLRPGEHMLIERGDIHGRMLHIRRRLDKYGIVDLPKNGLDRVVTVPPPAMDVLDAVPDRAPVLDKDGEPYNPLFRSKTGRPFSMGTLFYVWNAARNFAGRPKVDLYEATRHYCATYLLSIGVSHADVAVQLGHTDGGKLVMSTYGHPDEALARDRVLAAFDRLESAKVTPIRRTGA